MTRTRRSIVLLSVLVLATTLLAPIAGADPDTSRLEQLEEDLEQLEQRAAERRSAVRALDEREGRLSGEQARAQARLEEIEAELSLAVERYNEAVVALEEVEAELEATLAELAELEVEIGALNGAVADHARRLHKMGPSLEFALVVGASGPADIGFRSTSLRQIISADQVSLERLGAATDRAAALEARLVEQEAEATALTVEVEAQLVAVEELYDERADELAALEATLADVRQEASQQRSQLDADESAVVSARRAVAAERDRIEQERIEQERRAAREAEERRQAARQREQDRAAARASSSSTGSTGSSGASSSSSGASSRPGGGTPTPAPSTRRSADVAVSTALAQVGKPYRWGATGPGSFDCSGLTSYAWRAAGVTIPRTSGAQYGGLRKVTRAQLQPGDLVFYNSPISHVAMYVGGDTIVEASRTGIPVRTASLSNRRPVGYARP